MKVNSQNITYSESFEIDVHWIVTKNLKCIYVSDNIFDEFGYTVAEWLRSDVTKNKDYLEILRLTNLAAKEIYKNRFFCFESQIKHRDGRFIDVEVTFKAKLDDIGNFDGFFGTIRNISNREKLGKKFILNNKVIETKEHNSNFLLSIIAHNLINPFNIILGYTNLLKDKYEQINNKERIKYINKIDSYAMANYRLTTK